VSADLHGDTLRNTSDARGFGADTSAGLAQGFSHASTRDSFPARGVVPVPTAQGWKLVLADRAEALVKVMAHELRHMWQQHGTMKNSSFPVGRVKNAHGTYSEVCTEAKAIHKLPAWRRANGA
jgi:hypothetical protein